MNVISVETHRLYPGGIASQAVVERDQAGRLVRVVAVDYQYPGRDLHDMARTYAALRGTTVAVSA